MSDEDALVAVTRRMLKSGDGERLAVHPELQAKIQLLAMILSESSFSNEPQP
jgi:hypothetical protein